MKAPVATPLTAMSPRSIPSVETRREASGSGVENLDGDVPCAVPEGGMRGASRRSRFSKLKQGLQVSATKATAAWKDLKVAPVEAIVDQPGTRPSPM
jgi:hypothetical protein